LTGKITFQLPAKYQVEGRKQIVIEIRFGEGLQTVFPPSTHESGEPIEWVRDCALAQISGDDLRRRCALAASAAVLASLWPQEGARHYCARALNGFLRRCHLDAGEMSLFAHAIRAAAPSYRGADPQQIRTDTAMIADCRPLPKERTPGFPALRNFFDEVVVKRVADWLGYVGEGGDDFFTFGGESEQPRETHGPSETGAATVTARPFVCRNPKTIPPRQWLHAGHYVRGFLSMTVGPGGLGKTSLQLIEAIGMACGRDLLLGLVGVTPLRVWYWNLEDPHEEIERRIAAIMLHYEIKPEDLGDRLFVNSEEPLVIATAKNSSLCLSERMLRPATGSSISEHRRRTFPARKNSSVKSISDLKFPASSQRGQAFHYREDDDAVWS
jgi:hypothetical protein